MTPARVAALRRMIDETRAGLDGGTDKHDYARVLEESLDEMDTLRALTQIDPTMLLELDL